MMKSKEEIRKEILKKRRDVSSEVVKRKSDLIVEKFLENFLENYESFLLYASFDNEVRTTHLIDYLSEKGKSVFLPKMDKEQITVGKYEGMNSLKSNEYGILEPISSVDCLSFDVVVVPGVAFDESCFRLGFGKGYYDRFLKKIDYKKAVGFAFEFQIVDRLPVQEHDVRLDAIITEERIIGG